MNTINFIDPAISSIQYQVFSFPDGQPHLKIDTGTINSQHEQCSIYARISSPADILLVLMAQDVLYAAGLRRFALYISYLLAARMDRTMSKGEAFSLKIVGQLLNTGGFESIKIFDPHSDVAPAVLHHAHAIDNIAFAQQAVAHYRQQHAHLQDADICIVSPDAGALKKALKVSAALGGLDVVECLKIRDVKTGQLTGFKVFDESLAGKTCFIVDDICDGGGTFIGIAAILKEKNASAVVLAVSHGVFSKGTQLANVGHIYTTDSYKPLTSGEGLTVFPVMDYLR
jgi:ribose-phosphate pyrophosphokinase